MECHTLDPGFHGRLSCLPGVSPGSFPFLLRILKVVARLLRVDYSLKVKRKKKTCPKASVRLFLSLCACYLSQRGEVGCISAQGPGEESRVLFWRNVIRRYRVAAADSLCGVECSLCFASPGVRCNKEKYRGDRRGSFQWPGNAVVLFKAEVNQLRPDI